MKKKLVILFLCVFFIAGCSKDIQKPISLVQINSKDYGDTKHAMKIVETERNPRTSKLKLTYKKMGSSVGSSMFIMRGFYEVAKARGAEYFINLKEWDDPNGGRIFIAGFTNTKDANIHDEFGKQFSLKNDHGQARMYMSVSQCNFLWGQPPTNTTNKFSSTSMQVKQGNFFLAKKGNDYAAIKLTRKISKGDGGYKYVWYWQNDGSGSFTNKNAIKGEGEVFEKYLRTRKSATSCTVKDNGGILYIKCKNIKIQWSLNRWIYLSSRANLEIALINKKKIEDIDYLDKNIKWKTNRKAISQGKDTQYLRGFSQVFKTKNYAIDGALDMKYSFVVCDSKGTVLNKIANSTTTFLPKMGAGGCCGVRNKTNGYNYSLVII